MSVIEVIREKICTRDYYLSSHAEDEMAEDGFERADLESAILRGFVQKKLTRDPRGTRYRVEGPSLDGRTMQVLCRFNKARVIDYHNGLRKGVMKMKCEFCNSDTVARSVKKQHWFKGRLYIVENVDAEVCHECGERYFHAATLDKIDQMIATDHPVKKVLSVEVVTA